MSRPYFKNDLFHYTSSIQNQRNRDTQIQQTSAQSNKKHKDKQRQQKINIISDFDAQQVLKIQLNNNKEVYIEDQLKEVFAEMKNSKKTPSKQLPRKNIIFTPKSTLKFAATKITQDLSAKQKIQSQRKQKRQMWKMRQQLTKLLEIQEQKQHDKKQQPQNVVAQSAKLQKQQVEKSKNKSQQKNQQSVSSPSEKKQKPKARSTGKQKKIKKEANYVKTDLKRKYRDRFVGGLNKNLRMITKSGKIKRKYANMNKQLEISEGKMYNSFNMSLSKALFVTVDLDGEGDIQEPQKLNYSIPKTYQKQSLQKLIQQLFGFKTFRPGQYETIKNILQGKSTLFVSQTASGKSLAYLLVSVILKGLTIVISPLVSLMLDQIDHLPSDLPAACISSLLNHDQKDRIINMVKQGKIQLLYITPEIFLTDFMYHVRFFPPINFVCIDEAHSLSQLSHSFRSSYLSLQDIVLRYFRYKNQKPVVLCLTATANIQTMQSICQKMNIKQKICSKSVINKNLFVTISRQCLASKYQSVLKYLSHPQIRKCKCILIYCRTKRIMFDVFNYLRNSSAICHIYHSGLPQKQKVQTIQKFRNGQIRIVIATIALGMGLDFQNLQCIIHINMPKSVENYVQEIGRAGRRQKRAYCHLFLDKYDYFTERNYFLADQLDTKNLSQIIKTMKQVTNNIERRRKKKTSPNNENNNQKQQQIKLKRLTLQQKQQEDMNQYSQKQEIFQEQSQNQVKNSPQKENSKEGQKDKQNKQQILQVLNKDVKQDSQSFLPLSYCKSETFVESSGLKQQALLTLLLKIEKILGKNVIRIFPMTYQILKIGFFRKNQESIKKQSQFFRKLTQDCKVVKGMIYVPLIKKCNELKMPPIMLLTEVYGLSNTYCLKIQLVNDIFVWQHRISSRQTFKLLQASQNFQKVIQGFNIVQRTSLTKFNIFYSLCFNHSSKNLTNILDRNQIISQTDPLPSTSIIYSFDKYFSHQTSQFYKQIIDECQVEHQSKKIQEGIVESSYLPITGIDEEVVKQVSQCVQLFIRHVIINNPDKKFIPTLAPYRDGRIMTRVFMGVNDNNSNWKTYGQHPYWMKFVDKDYRKLLKIVRKQITNYVVREGSKMLELQSKNSIQSVKRTNDQLK